jgi:hypothetical protein
MRVAKRRLERVQFDAIRRQRFDSLDRVSVCLDRDHDAGTCRLAVEENRARAAYAVLAADVGSGEAEILAQEIAQEKPRFHIRLSVGAIDDDSQDHLGPRRIVAETALVLRSAACVCRRKTCGRAQAS